MKENTADDVWYEIFLHLPLDSIFRSKCVSKVWLSTLSSPNFINKWFNLNCASLPWVLVQHAGSVEEDSGDANNRFRRNFAITYPDSHSQFIENRQNGFSFSFLDPIFQDSNDDQECKKIFLISSSNGLVLCVAWLNDQRTYCVCNPLTRKWLSIPPPPTQKFWVTGFMCNDGCFSSSLISTSFKVIRIPKFEDAVKEFKVEMFSSELSEWNVYDVSCAQDVTWNISSYDNFVTHNGVFYWFQKANRRILAVSIGGNTNHGTCGRDCRLINLPDGAMDGDIKLHHCLGVSEGLICYASVNEEERSLSVWVLEEDWCLLYKDKNFHGMLVEKKTLLIGGVGTDDLITQIEVVGFSPDDKNVVILGYDKYVWAYNTRTKGYEQLSHPSFLHINGSVHHVNFLTFALKPRPSVLPSVSW